MSVQNSVNRNYPIPIGVVLPFCGINIPKGFLKCDGTSYSISAYPELAEVLDGIYGSSSTTFDVPDLVGNLIQGSSTNAGTVNPAVINPGDNVSTTLGVSNIPSFITNTITTQPTITATPNQAPITTSVKVESINFTGTQDIYEYTDAPQNPGAVNVTSVSATGAFTNGSLQPLSIAASRAVPANYTMVYIIRATNQL
jgi:microcystin-dependent protein